MELSIKERLLLLNILPAESNFVTLKIVRKLQEDLSFSEDEIKEAQFKTIEGKVNWNPNANVIKDVEFGEKANDLIIESLQKLDKQNKLTLDYFDLYEKFVK